MKSKLLLSTLIITIIFTGCKSDAEKLADEIYDASEEFASQIEEREKQKSIDTE